MSDYRKPTFNFFDEESQGAKNKRISTKQEKLIAKTGQKGKLTPGSGNKGIKGDVWKMERMYEAKVTAKKSIKVDLEWLKKLERESTAARKDPVFVFGFDDSGLRDTHWGAVPIERLEELFELEAKYRDLQN